MGKHIEYDGLPPADFVFPSKAAEFEERIEFMLLEVRHIADGDMVAYRASNVFCSLQSVVKRDGVRITGSQRDRLLTAFARARYQVLSLFPLSSEIELASTGYDAIAGLIIWWSESSVKRAQRPCHLFTDLHAYVRWLRNACHNIALLEQVQERAYNRRARAIAELHERAVA